jgi:hypothetical protein
MFRVPIGGNKARLLFIGTAATTDTADVHVVGVA